jgi:hypothetical protein
MWFHLNCDFQECVVEGAMTAGDRQAAEKDVEAARISIKTSYRG